MDFFLVWMFVACLMSLLVAGTRSVAVGSSLLVFGGAAKGRDRLNYMHWLGPSASDPSRLEWSRAVASGAQQPPGALLQP